MIDYEKLDALAAGLMKHRKAHLFRETGFIYRHGKRTAVGVIALRKRVTGEAGHDDALRIAAMFHDIGKGIEPHARTGALLAQDALAGHVPPQVLAEAVYLIAEHNNRAAEGAWARLLQDADVLDHFGAVEVGLSFQYGIENGEGMEMTLDWYQTHFEPYAEKVRNRLHSDAALAVFDEKIAFTRAFAGRFFVESTGAYADEAEWGCCCKHFDEGGGAAWTNP